MSIKVGFVNLTNPEADPVVVEIEEADDEVTTFGDILELMEIEFDPDARELFYRRGSGDLYAAEADFEASDREVLLLTMKLPERCDDIAAMMVREIEESMEIKE